MEGFDEVLGEGGEEDELSVGDGSESFDAISESDSSEHFADDTSDKSRKKPRQEIELANSDLGNLNNASDITLDASSSGSRLKGGCGDNNIDDDGSYVRGRGRPAKPTAAQTGQQARRERERDVTSYSIAQRKLLK